jgi:acyl-coenzyme A thioesterase PaaI-like protein
LYTKEIIVAIYVSLWWQTMQPTLEELIARGENSPFDKLLDIKIEEVRNDCARLSIEVAKKHIQFLKTVHGGVVASLADSAAAWAVYGSVSLASEFRKSARILGRS